MTLPELTWQIAYGRVGWGLVLAALLLALLPALLPGRWRPSRRVVGVLLALCLLLQLLPDKAAPSYWLGLAFTWPSGLLTGLCIAKLAQHWHGGPATPVMRTGLAIAIAISGGVLYLEAIGLLSLDLYYRGFDDTAAPAIGLLLGAGACWAAIAGKARAQSLAVLLAVLLFSVFRLPSGNVWDAMLDPLLWGWACWTLCQRGWRHWRLGRRAWPAAVLVPR